APPPGGPGEGRHPGGADDPLRRGAGVQRCLLLPPPGGGEGDQEGSEATEEGATRCAAVGPDLGGGEAGDQDRALPADRGGEDLRLRDLAALVLPARAG